MNFDLPTRGEKYPLLDAGHVTFVDYMGDEADIVDAARVSYKRQGQSSDYDLLRYLMRNRHTSPFEMCELKVIIKCPIFVARQWVRHRTASLNEVSGRYTELSEEAYTPAPGRLTKQSSDNKQGSSDEVIDNAKHVSRWMADDASSAFADYRAYLSTGMAKEIARINLTLSTYTEFVWKIDLHNLLHFLKLRCDQHAQYEIRVYANALLEIANRIWPNVIKAWQDYVLSAMTLSYHEQTALNLTIKGFDKLALRVMDREMSSRERKEFLTKLAILGITPPQKGEDDE